MTNALMIIRWEHHSIESVLHAMIYFVDQMWAGKVAPENKVFSAMLQYIDLFAEHLHHPKEDRHLFRRLRLRTHQADELLDAMEADHRCCTKRIRTLKLSFLRYEAGGMAYFYAFATSIRDYANFYRAHMRSEEEILFPMAERFLTDRDWQAIDTAFARHADYRFSPQVEHDLDRLFDHILNIVPASIGAVPDFQGTFRSARFTA